MVLNISIQHRRKLIPAPLHWQCGNVLSHCNFKQRGGRLEYKLFTVLCPKKFSLGPRLLRRGTTRKSYRNNTAAKELRERTFSITCRIDFKNLICLYTHKSIGIPVLNKYQLGKCGHHFHSIGRFSHRVAMSVTVVSVTIQNTHFRRLWRTLVEGRTTNIGVR